MTDYRVHLIATGSFYIEADDWEDAVQKTMDMRNSDLVFEVSTDTGWEVQSATVEA